jgi:glycosidase
MPLKLDDPQVRAAFDAASMPSQRRVQVGPEMRTIRTPFASPADWRDGWIYFLLLDRFNRADGRPPRNLPYDQPFGGYQGGSFNGVRAELDYIRDLGARAIWLSPVLKNRPSDHGSFHGYGIQDFLQPEPRFASAPGKEDEELRALVDEAHARGLYVIFDIVLNHAGDLFAYEGFGASAPWSEEVRAIQWRDAAGTPRPQWSDIDAVPASERVPDGLVWPAELQHNAYFRRKGMGGEAGGDFDSLKEFVTDVTDGALYPVRNAQILAYQYAIARYDIDGFRIDTLKYIERSFAQVFGNAMREYALSIGKKNFFTFGEVFDGEQRIAEFIGRNTKDGNDLVGVDAALDFPLFFHLPWVAKGFAPPTDVVDVYRVRKEVERDILSSHGEAGRFFVTFLDNHDMHQRFRSAASDGPDAFDPQVLLGITLLFCLQGIPCLYYGTEQGLHGHGDSDQCVREALWGKPGAFDAGHPFYTAIRKLTTVRDRQPALRYGRLYFRPLSGGGVNFGASPFAPGVLAFSRILNDEEVLVLANASTQDAFEGDVLVDFFINDDGDAFTVLNDAGATPPGPVASRSGLEIREVDGSFGTGPARMIRVRVAPMQALVLGNARVARRLQAA